MALNVDMAYVYTKKLDFMKANGEMAIGKAMDKCGIPMDHFMMGIGQTINGMDQVS